MLIIFNLIYAVFKTYVFMYIIHIILKCAEKYIIPFYLTFKKIKLSILLPV